VQFGFAALAPAGFDVLQLEAAETGAHRLAEGFLGGEPGRQRRGRVGAGAYVRQFLFGEVLVQ